MMFDPERVHDAKLRAAEAIEQAEYYEQRARRERALAVRLAVSWRFDLDEVERSRPKAGSDEQ